MLQFELDMMWLLPSTCLKCQKTRQVTTKTNSRESFCKYDKIATLVIKLFDLYSIVRGSNENEEEIL